MQTQTTVRLSGDPRSRGIEHGRRLATQIKRLLRDNCARINCHVPNPIPEKQIYTYAQQFAIEIERELPSIAEEIKGLSEGAGISYEQAVLLQVRREVLMLIRKGASTDCSTLSLPINTRTIAQSIDLNSSFAEFGTVLQIAPWHESPEILMYSFAGLLGYMGMNSFGVGIAINMVSSDDWQLGVPPYLLVRHLLELPSVDACLVALNKIKRSSSRSLTICDDKRNVTVEMAANSLAVLEETELFHTNHYLSENMIPKDSINFLARNSSSQRLSRLRNLTEQLPKTPTTNDLFGLFADHENYPVGLCSHAEGDHRRTETVATVVMHPASGVMYVRRGLPCSAQEIEKFTLVNQSNSTSENTNVQLTQCKKDTELL